MRVPRKIVIAMMQHETNTFSAIPTDWAAFGAGLGADGPVQGPAVARLFAGTGMAIGAFIDEARARGCEIATPIAAYAEPSGTVRHGDFERIAAIICDAVRAGCDAVLLDLHGAMVTTEQDDGEGALLHRLRRVDGDVPIGVALDFHANLSPAMVEAATVITGYRTYPHVDMYETGERCARTIFALLDGQARPRMVWGRLPLLAAMVRQDPAREPMLTPMTRAIDAEAGGRVLNASIFGGFPLADNPFVGVSTVIVTDGADAEGPRLRDAILAAAWSGRAGFAFTGEPVAETVATARTVTDGPVVLADYGDNCGAGGAVDDMSVIAEALRQGLDGILAGPICDPEALAAATDAGVGAPLSLTIGGKTPGQDAASTGLSLDLTGRVSFLGDGRFRLEGAMMSGFPVDLKGCAVIKTAPLTLIISGARVEPYVPQYFLQAGLDPADFKYIIIKSRQHFRAGFEPIARHILLARGRGACDENYHEKMFRRLARPIYPLDPETSFIGGAS